MTSEHDNDPRLRQIREIAVEALRATNHTDVMEYPASQRRNAAMPPRPPTSLRHGLPGVRTGGHGWTRQHRLSQPQQPQPEYTVPSPLQPENDPPGWTAYPESQSQSQWGARASCDSFFGGGSDWDSYFHNYQLVDRVGEEEGDDEEGEGEEEEGGESRSEEDVEVVISRPPTEGSSRPTGKSSSSKLGKAMHNVLRGFSTRKNKGKAPTKFTPSGK